MRKEHISLWHKIQTFYHYSWMDWEVTFHAPIAPPSWFLTHTQEQIDQLVAAHEARIARQQAKIKESIRAFEESQKARQNQEQ